MDGRKRAQTRIRVKAFSAGHLRNQMDLVATEEPLEIRMRINDVSQSVAVTMRTPGSDFELAAGFLFSEGLIQARDEIGQITYCVDTDALGEQQYNVVSVDPRYQLAGDRVAAVRQFTVSSACGVCGKESIDQIERRGITAVETGLSVSADVLALLPDRLREAQGLFTTTGGLHAAGLFTADGTLVQIREDVGRHNAVDKLIGWALLEGRLPLRDSIVLVSGRSSFEIVQKCVAAGVSVLCSVSAPSSLAVQTAQRFNLTLVGFLRGATFNVYHDSGRVLISEATAD